jgi:agmatine deiminase
MSENLAILENSKDQNGNSFKIIKVPLPDLIEKKVVVRKKIDNLDSTYDVAKNWFKESEAPEIGDTLIRIPAASYLNFLLTNGLVILPTYSNVGSSIEKEKKVQSLFEKQFPDRKIIFIDVMPQNWFGGGIHCSAMQQPALFSDTNR